MSIATVHSAPAGPIHIGRIAYGQDILETLEAYCAEHKIETAWVNLLGALSEATLAYYEQDGHTYVTRDFRGEYEILNGTGNITLKDGKPFGHLHLTLSGTDFQAVGGHLMKGTVKVFACEFVLFTGTGGGVQPLCRIPDAETGLALWPNSETHIENK